MIVTFSFSFLLHSTRQIKFSIVGIVSLILSRRHFFPCFCDEAKRVAIFILCISQKSSSGPKKNQKKTVQRTVLVPTEVCQCWVAAGKLNTRNFNDTVHWINLKKKTIL